MTRRWWLAPALDLVCIVTFIFVGAGRHNINEGADWFLLVFWPIAVGWYGVALFAKLYTAQDKIWMRLAITIAAGTVVMSALRGAFTDRPTVSIFTVVFVAWMVLTAYAWRLVAKWLGARRARGAPATS